MEILSDLQKRVIKYIGRTKLNKYFFLTGGSALAHYYLKHRYSDDLIFFTGENGKIRLVKDKIVKLADDLNLKYKISRGFETLNSPR